MTVIFSVDYIIALQDPANDDAAFKKFRETNGQDLLSLIRKWEYGCKEMESRMNLMIDRIRKESFQEDGHHERRFLYPLLSLPHFLFIFCDR